jgi:hypothetical protein
MNASRWRYKHLQNHPKCVVVIQYEWWLLDMTLVLNGNISGALGFLLVGTKSVRPLLGNGCIKQIRVCDSPYTRE